MTINLTIIDTQTGEITIKPLDKIELQIMEDTKIEHQNYLASLEAKAAAKTAAQAKLAALGLTVEDLQALGL